MAAATTTTPSTALTMKLLVDSQRWRVVFAEAGKDTVDFLFSLLAVPAGTSVKLLGKESMVGCMGNLYGSAERLEEPYVQPGAAKDVILGAAMPPPAAVRPNSWVFPLPAPAPAAPAPAPKKFYNCGNSYYRNNCGSYVTEVSGTCCPNCGNRMYTETNLVGSPQPVDAKEPVRKGFVQGGMVVYTVTDDLVISPMSNVSTIALLNACGVRDFGMLQERTVQIGYKEGLEILRASLQSKTVLTDVFLGKKPPSASSMKNGGMKNGGSTPQLSNGTRRDSLSWRA
ncbi:uncharacterized protein LOC133928714 [Phragmites australis]|uniref:uncharacterized protein LOC133928714 n=1 Tax=Phragmites australis TaxID=29695 RepID=UPI002D794D4F|nr:uncharacterized protein LOC133928714 [Phragmites australis]